MIVNSYKQITFKFLKNQRNRTLLTILGIVLSVAMITSIGTIIESARESMIKDAIRDNGSHHAIFSDLEQKEIDNIRNHINVDEIGVGKREGAVRVAELTE